jgi:hypothetical protein
LKEAIPISMNAIRNANSKMIQKKAQATPDDQVKQSGVELTYYALKYLEIAN